MLWKTSDAIYGYVPPTEQAVNEFYAKLKGHNLADFKDCFMGEEPEHVTNATSTTSRLVESIAEALAEVNTLLNAEDSGSSDTTSDDPAENVARIIGISALSVMVLGLAAYIAVPKIIKRRKQG